MDKQAALIALIITLTPVIFTIMALIIGNL